MASLEPSAPFTRWTYLVGLLLQRERKMAQKMAPSCPDCGNVYATDSKFCRKCGKERGVTECPDCGNVYAEDSKFCRKCGKPRARVGLDDDVSSPETRDVLKLDLQSTGDVAVEEESTQTPTTACPSSVHLSDYAHVDQSSKAESMSPGSMHSHSYSVIATSEIAKQHYEWSQELESVDQKQADLMMVQWKMIRDQTGMMAQQLIEVRKELEATKLQSASTAARLESHVQDHKGLEQRLSQSVRQSWVKINDDLGKVRNSLEAELQKRAVQDIDMFRRLEALEASSGPAMAKLEREVDELRAALDSPLKQLPKLRDQLRQHADDWKNGQLMAMEHSTKLHDGLSKGLRDMMLTHETHKNEVQQTFNQHRGSFDKALDQLRDHVGTRLADLPTQREDPTLRGRLQELDDKMIAWTREQARALEGKLKEKDTKCQELERSVEHLTATLGQESQARQSLAEVFEQMIKAERTKLVNMMTQKAACARLDCKELQKALMDLLAKEAAEREEQSLAIKEDLQGLSNGLGERVNGMEGECRGLQQTWHSAQVSLRSFEAQLRKLETGLEGCAQGLRVELRSSLEKERLQRELADTSIGEQVDFLEGFHRHMRDFYISRRHAAPELRAAEAAEATES